MVLGIDIGGTNIKFGIVDANYSNVKSYSIPTPTDKGDVYLVEQIINKVHEIKKEYDFDRIGIGTPGRINSEEGIVIRASNLPYKNTPIVKMLENEFHLPVKLANDATCAIYGEFYAGFGQKYDNFIMITLGTGVGGGIVLNNKIYMGKNGNAGEIGHIIIKYDGLQCPCGQIGCYEQYASVTALIRQTKTAIENNPDSLLAKSAGYKISGRTAFDAMKKGCPVAAKVVDDYINYIAIGIKSLVRIFQPDAIVLGGAISNEGDNLLLPLREKVTMPVEILISNLKNDAGVLGAASAASQIEGLK
ncbi:MAG: ROK family protein [Ruminococcaceae bacterium]|nr:ROK family protein [Oscillospiraceae bacterium]